MLTVRLSGDHLYGKKLFILLSLVMSLMVLLVLSFFPTRCLGCDLGLKFLRAFLPALTFFIQLAQLHS